MSDQKKAETIHQAIAAAIGEVKKIGKTDRNKFDGYDFASIDKFLEMVNPICAAHGLFPFITQTSVETYENINSKGGKSVWVRFTFDVSLFHASGQQFGPSVMMVSVPMTGAQSSGTAQSYALKQFFRALFMIPTGDKDDADLNPNEQHQVAPPKQSRPNKTPQVAAPTGEEIEAAKVAVQGAQTLDDLVAIWDSLTGPIKFEIADAKDKRKAELQAAPNADIGGDEIPY